MATTPPTARWYWRASGLLVGLALALSSLSAAPTASAAPAARVVATSLAGSVGTTTRVQDVEVDWDGCEAQPKKKKKAKKRKYKRKTKKWFQRYRTWLDNNPCAKRTSAKQATATVPGIGNVTLRCRPNRTEVSLWTPNRDAETQMWLQKYEDKRGEPVVAVKVPRIYRYAHPDDPGDGGTGLRAHEGLNQVSPIENYAKGYLNGVISQRPGRHVAASSAAPKPVTTFTLSWYWNGFDQPKKYQSCNIDAQFTTRYDHTIGLNWHGNNDSIGHTDTSTRLPGIGYLDLTCETGTPGRGNEGLTAFSFRPDNPNDSSLYLEVVDGEGLVEDHVEAYSPALDDTTQAFGPLELPRNGTVRMLVSNRGAQQWVLLSSVSKTNDPIASHNFCEIAGGRYDP